MASLVDRLSRLDGTSRLGEVRERLVEALRVPEAEPLLPPALPLEALLLEEERTPLGRLRFCKSHHRRDERLGSIALGSVLTADATLLALLALNAELAGCALERALFLDTETTGLGGGTGCWAFLIGLCHYDAAIDRFVLEQLFVGDPDEEHAALARCHERFAAAELVVSYNGRSFDVPLLAQRMVMNRLERLPQRPQLDLLHVARRVHACRRWGKRLGTVEREVLGYDRGPDIAGEEVAQRYRHYLRWGDGSVLEGVVEHNRRDVLSLLALAGLYGEHAFSAVSIGGGPRSPSAGLEPADLAQVARTMRRAGAIDRAMGVAELAAERSGGSCVEAARACAEIAKARGDKARALAELEGVYAAVDPHSFEARGLRLELAKLYEHFAKDPARALALVERGTDETPAAAMRRRSRLARRLGRTR